MKLQIRINLRLAVACLQIVAIGLGADAAIRFGISPVWAVYGVLGGTVGYIVARAVLGVRGGGGK